MKNNDHLTNRARTRQSVALPSWTPSRSPVKSSRFECHVQRVKRRIGFLIAIGASNRDADRLGRDPAMRWIVGGAR